MAMMFRRSLSTSPTSLSNTIQNVAIIGGGLMGAGIAQVAAQAGQHATIVDVKEEALKKAVSEIQHSTRRVAKRMFKENPTEQEQFVKNTMSRIKVSVDMKEAVKNVDLVLEAVTENLELKQKLFATVDPIAREDTIFASNTSSLSIAEISSLTKRKDKFGGLHFFSPVPVMKLLEVVRIPETSDETYEKMMAWGKAIGKTTITCKDTPGFVVNRLLVPQLAEAVRMLQRGDATAKDIDTAMKLGAGFPMGPLELADFTGIDTPKYILDGWHKKFPDNPLFEPVPLLNKLVEEGKLGKKTGEGFYKYQ